LEHPGLAGPVPVYSAPSVPVFGHHLIGDINGAKMNAGNRFQFIIVVAPG
jgi:hypothetical protein